jgi:hypothetical protein
MSVGGGVELLKLLYIDDGVQEWNKYFWKQFGSFTEHAHTCSHTLIHTHTECLTQPFLLGEGWSIFPVLLAVIAS